MNTTKQTSIEKIKAAIEKLEGKGIAATQLNISIEIILSTRTIKKYWKDIQQDNRVKVLPVERVKVSKNRVKVLDKNMPSNAFDRFKRRTIIREYV